MNNLRNKITNNRQKETEIKRKMNNRRLII